MKTLMVLVVALCGCVSSTAPQRTNANGPQPQPDGPCMGLKCGTGGNGTHVAGTTLGDAPVTVHAITLRSGERVPLQH